MSNSTRGRSYQDPLYDTIEAALERKYGLPSGGMSAIRTKGERSDADQVSPVGARSVYQIMPDTRRRFLNAYGVDAYASPESAAEVAALHLRDSMKRNGGDWAAAVGEYHGGTDRRNWGNVNQAYRERVLGPGEGARAPMDVPRPKVPTVEEILGSTPKELFGETDAALREAKRAHIKVPSVQEIVRAAFGPIDIAPLDTTPVRAEVGMERAAVAEHKELESFSSWDHFKAGMSETLAGELIDILGEQHQEWDPSFGKFYLDNWQDIESFAQDDEEVAMLREARNADHLRVVQQNIEEKRQREKIISSSASPTALMIGTGILDPVGWAAGFGVGKGFQMAGMGSRALAIAGRPGMAVASAAMEGAVGNLAVTAGLDAAGDYVSPSEYGMSALTGLAIGGVLGGFANRQIGQARVDQERYIGGIREGVARDMPDAAPEQIAAEVDRRVTQGYLDTIDYALADIPEDQRILVAEDILTQNEQFKQQLIEANDLESVSDITERAMVAEATARAERIVAANPVDEKALQTVLSRFGQEATSTRLLLSKSPVARAAAISLLENPQGAAGRHRTAAITAGIRERVYNEQLSGFDALSAQFRKTEGVTLIRDAWDGTGRNAFNRRVFAELERRGKDGYTPDANPFVKEAADLFEGGMEKMRLEQQKVGTVGHMRLGDSSVGYVPHRLDPRKVLGLTGEQTKRVRGVLSGQFQEIEGFDAAFSDKLAAKYLERAVDAASGRYHVPFNLHSPEAGQIVEDALNALNLDPADVQKLMGKFSRGGAGHTKRRLKLDLDADIGDGAKLMDLFVTDIPTLYRSYARRVAGEVALAQYGVMGKKGLTVLSKAMTATGAAPKEIEAFDQIASEFLNTPFGNARYAWMDNLRLTTSASRLGGMAFTQFAEFGNAVPSLGVQASLRGVASMPRHMADVRAIASGKSKTPNPMLKSIDKMGGGIGMDDYHMTRMFDVRDNEIEMYNGSELGVFSRAARAGAHANMILSGHRMIMAAQTRSMAEEVLRKAVTFAKSGRDDVALNDMGIHQGLRDAIRADLDRIATFDSKGRVTALDLFKGDKLTPALVAELTQAVERGSAQIIQRTFHGETGKWAHNDFLKTLLQFRTFSITSVEKQWGRNMRNYGAMKSFMYLMAAASFAVPIHLARVQAKLLAMEPSKREKYWETNSNPVALGRATMNYASSAGLAGDIMDLGVGAFSKWGGDMGEALGDSYGIRGKRSDKFVGGVVAPGAGLADDVFSGIIGRDPHKIIRSLPGSNLPYVTPFITAASEAVDGE